MLRFGGRRLGGCVYWPQDNVRPRSPLIFVPIPDDAPDSDPLCRLLSSAAATVVLVVPSPHGTDRDYELAALEWAVDHAAELGAEPGQRLGAGDGVGAAHAALLAIRARDSGWPPLRRQVLVYPTFNQTCPMPSLLTGVAPATVVSSDTRTDDGGTYAARLRASDIDVDELRYPSPVLPGHDELSVALTMR
jgi:acetyl esterase/lipase